MDPLKKFKYPVLVVVLTLLALPAAALGAAFSVTVPAGTEVVMSDSTASIPATVTHNGPDKAIRSITFTLDTADYAMSTATVPPEGWCVDSVGAGSITFALVQGSGACSNGSTASEINSGESVEFDITVTPAPASADVAGDTFSSVTVNAQGGFTLSGGLPTWTRRALSSAITATPESVGAGDGITVSMEVSNRSTASQSSVSSSPDPPTPSSPLVTLTDGPFYSSTLLDGAISSTDTSVTVDSTDEFPSTGTIKIDSEEVCYTSKSGTAFTGLTRGCNGTAAAAHSNDSTVAGLTAPTLPSGSTVVISWVYRADLTGALTFSSKATASAGVATSPVATSNTVVIGDFTATLSGSPASIISGQTATVRMGVANNGSSALVNVSPGTLSPCAGGAAETFVSGPSPALISSLAPGSSGVFEWSYQVTGSVGDQWCVTGSATADGPVSTNTATSNTGVISNYSVTVAPSTVASSSTNVTIVWSVYNGGGSDVNGVSIDLPATGVDWTCSAASPPSGWSGGCADPVVFSSANKASDIPPGGTAAFSITFSTTETVTADEDVVFPVTITVRGGGGFSATLGTTVKVTVYGLTLAHTPTGPVDADGGSYYEMTATLNSGGSPVSGKTVTFAATNGTLESSTASTDSLGEATVRLDSPISTTDTSAVVTASYLGTTATDTVAFTGWTGANPQYWGSLTPATVDCGSSYSFTMDLRNVSTTTSVTLSTASYFAYNDTANGGTAVMLAYLDSSLNIPPSSTVTATFGSAGPAGGGGGVSVPAGFIAGSYQPTSNPAPPPESGLFLTDGAVYDLYRTVTDSVSVQGSCGSVGIDIIDWREM